MKRAVATLSLTVLVAAAQAQTEQSSLAAAIAKKQKDAVVALIGQGADVNGLHEGATPLYRAVVVGDIQIVELLLSRGADANAPSSDRDLPSRIATRFGNSERAFETVEALMVASVGRDARPAPAERLTPLHAAYAAQIIGLLLARGAQVDARDAAGNTPLFWVCLGYNQTGAGLLLERGANINSRNKGGLSALDAASAMNHSMLRSWLLSKGAVVSSDTVDLHPGQNLHDRLEQMRLPITAYLLGQRNDDAALSKIMDWRDTRLLETYVPGPYSVSKFRMNREKLERLQPVLKQPWLSDRARENVVWQVSRSGLPGIEQALIDALPLVPERSRQEIEGTLAERRFEAVLPYLSERIADGNYLTCKNLALIGSTAAARVMVRCLARLTELGRGGHQDALYALSKHGGLLEVDFVDLRKALPSLMDEATTARYFELVGKHQAASEVPALLTVVRDNAPDSRLGREARGALARFDSEEVQKQVVAELGRLHAAGKLDEPSYRYVTFSYAERKRLSAFYGSPIAEQEKTGLLYARDKEEVARIKYSAEQSRETRPEQFVREYENYLVRLAALAEKYRNSVYHDGLRSEVASGYAMLANFARFKLKRPSQSLDYQVKSAPVSPGTREGEFLNDLLAADLFQYDISNRGKALEAYRRAAEKLRASKIDTGTWLTRAVAHEISYLESGKTFSGYLSGEELGQFLGIVFIVAAGNLGDPGVGLPQRPESMSAVQRKALESQLEDLAPSHLNFAKAVPLLSQLSSERSVLRFLRKHDPGGYWSASLVLLVLHPETVGERGAAMLFPGIKSDAAQATALAAAARTFAKQGGISFQPPDGRRATPVMTWQLLLDSLRAGDAATALACLTPGMRAKMEPLFSKMAPAAMREMADSFTAFALQGGGSDETRGAVLSRRSGEKQIAGFAYFVRYAGEWKIDEM